MRLIGRECEMQGCFLFPNPFSSHPSKHEMSDKNLESLRISLNSQAHLFQLLVILVRLSTFEEVRYTTHCDGRLSVSLRGRFRQKCNAAKKVALSKMATPAIWTKATLVISTKPFTRASLYLQLPRPWTID